MYILVYFIISHVLFNYVMIHFRDQRELALFLAHSNSYMHILEITRRPISSIYKDFFSVTPKDVWTYHWFLKGPNEPPMGLTFGRIWSDGHPLGPHVIPLGSPLLNLHTTVGARDVKAAIDLNVSTLHRELFDKHMTWRVTGFHFYPNLLECLENNDVR